MTKLKLMISISLMVILFENLSTAAILSDHLSSDDPHLGGILAMNNVHSRQRRTIRGSITKGSALAIVWCITFPVKTLTKLGAGLEFCHPVILPLRKLYPEKTLKQRIDLLHGHGSENFLDLLSDASELDINRKGEVINMIPKYPTDIGQESVEENWSQWNLTSDETLDSQNELETYPEQVELQNLLRMDRFNSRRDRILLYKDLQSLIERMGLPGRPCLLRTICEVGEHPFEDSLYGEPLNILMMASLGGYPEFPEEEEEYSKFVEAEIHGREVGRCDQKFKECSNSLFFLIYDLLKDVLF